MTDGSRRQKAQLNRAVGVQTAGELSGKHDGAMLPFVLQISPHDLVEVWPWKTRLLRCVCHVSLMKGQLARDIPAIKILEYLFLGFGIRQCEVAV